jgi:hypothetical protein
MQGTRWQFLFGPLSGTQHDPVVYSSSFLEPGPAARSLRFLGHETPDDAAEQDGRRKYSVSACQQVGLCFSLRVQPGKRFASFRNAGIVLHLESTGVAVCYVDEY